MKLRNKRKYKTFRSKYSFTVHNWINEIKLYLRDAPIEDAKDFVDNGRVIYSLNRFINGECFNFALACEKVFGLVPCVFMTTTDNGYEGIGHCFGIVGKRGDDVYILDAKGIRTMEQAVSEFSDFRLDQVYVIDKQFIKDWYSMFSTDKRKIRKQNTITQRLNKIAGYYIRILFDDVAKQLKNWK